MCLQIGCIDENLPPWLMLGDCLERMKEIPDGSVDMILADLPYGTTDIKGWDKIIPIDLLWELYIRVIKQDGNILLFGTQPFSAFIITSNPKMFRYEWVWDKTRGCNFLNANCQPMKCHENILCFSMLPASPNKKGTAKYNPQKSVGKSYVSSLGKKTQTFNGGEIQKKINKLDGRHPTTIVTFKKDGKLHPTQKPIALLEYLIKTYTNEGEVVLDNVMGSGSTGVACMNTGRKFIGIEKDEKYFHIAEKRIQESVQQEITDNVWD